MPADYDDLQGAFDTALSVNVLEYLDDPALTLRSLFGALQPGGTLLALVPQGNWLFGSIDRTLGHRRRFSRRQLRELLEQAGFKVEKFYQLNRAGVPAWALYGRVLHRKSINKVTLKLFDKTVWLWRLIDALLPWPGLTLVVVARKPA